PRVLEDVGPDGPGPQLPELCASLWRQPGLAGFTLDFVELDAALAFYTGFLGLRELRRRRLGDEATLVFLSDGQGSHQIELTFNHDGRAYELGNQFGHLAFVVDDLAAVLAEIERR